MSSTTNQSFMNSSRNTSRRSSALFSNRSNLDDTMASRQSREESLISASRFKSPFYEGKVSFGGSSAKRVRLSQVLPYNLATKPTNVMRIKESDIKRQNEFDHLSSASRNVLQNIYKTSSPLEDAKKIPVYTSNESTENNKYFIDIHKPFKRLSSLRTPKLAATLKTSSPIDREKLQLKWEELENSIVGQTNHQHSSSPQQRHPQQSAIGDAKASRTYYSSVEEPHASGAGGKMRARLTRTNRSGKPSDEEYQPAHELPNMPLPINANSLSTLNFNFNKKAPTELRAQTLVHQQHLLNSQIPNQFSNVNSLKRPLVSITQDDSSLDDDEFQFSAPKLIKLEKISDSFVQNSIRKDLDDQPNFSNQIGGQRASQPAAATGTQFNQQQQSPQKQQTSTITSTIASSSPNLPSIKSSTELMSSETNKTVGMYKLDKLDTDFNPKENKATLANTNLPAKMPDNKLSNTFNYDGLDEQLFKKQSQAKTWECDTCSVRNDFMLMKCAACDLPRLKESKDKNVHSIYSDYSFGTINTEKKDSFTAFKLDAKPTAQQPPISLVSSSNSTGLSGALSTVNAVSLPSSTPALNNSLSSVLASNKVDLTTDSKSPSIALSSSSNSSKPLANSVTPVKETKPFNFITSEVADKIDSKPSSTPSSSAPSLTWGTQFLPPKDNWSCPTCLASNKSTEKKCLCCEEPNPSLPKEAKADTKASAGICFDTSSTGGFKFNLAASNSSTIKNDFSSFLNKTATTTETEKNKAPTTGGFKFNLDAIAKSSAPANGTSSAPTFSFQSSLANSQNAESKPVTEPIKALTNLANSKEPIASTNLFTKPAESSSTSNNTGSLFSMPTASTAAPPTFMFGNDTSAKTESKPATSMVFGTAATPAPTNNLNNSTGGISFNLPQSTSLSTSTGLGSQAPSTGFFNSTNNTSTGAASFTFGGNKPQFGLPTSSVPTNLSTNLFAPPSLPGTNSLTNGFGSVTTPVDQAPTNNLFSSAGANQPPAEVNNFANVFSQVPSTFNFGSDQSAANQSVFQFSA